MTSKKSKVTPEEVLEHFLWECGDCKNIYTKDIHYCPNEILDNLLVRGVVLNDR